MLCEKLTEFLKGDEERCGFVLKTGEIVEVENICEDRQNGFQVKSEDVFKHLLIAEATWHTHPGASKNLSANDHQAFRNFPEWKHYIIGEDGVACYVVQNGMVIVEG